jgi:uncharacterized protein (DUF1778 family)
MEETMHQVVRKRESSRKDDVIQIRASAEMKAILNQAASRRGQKLSEFMLESARHRAEEDLLDQRVFFLSPKDHEKFLALLDNPPKPTKALRALMSRKAPWER